MKKLTTLSLSLMATGLLFVTGCQEQEKTVETTTPDTAVVDNTSTNATRTAGPVDVQSEEVPTTVQTSFKSKYANAGDVKWKRYYATQEEDDVRLIPNNDYYYVIYNNDGMNYNTWYDTTGMMVKQTMMVSGPKELPDAVNMTINKEYPGFKITEIEKDNDKDMDIFEIDLEKGESKAVIKVTPDGTIVKRKDKS